MKQSLNRIFIFTKRNLKEIIRDPLSLIFLIALPAFLLILFYFIFHNLTAQFEIKYLAPSIVVFAQSFITLFAGLLISMDKSTSFLTRLYVSPTKSHEFILGYALALLPIGIMQTALFFIIGGILDSSFWSLSMLLAILVSLIPSLLFIGLGILFGSLCNEKSIGGISSIVIVAQSILSGMWFPVEGLSAGIIGLMNALPFKNANNLLIHTLSGTENVFADILQPILIIVAYTIVIYILAILIYNKKMKQR